MKIGRRLEPIRAENLLDDLWIEVKSQAALEIAGSPRNIFRDSLKS